MNFLPKDLEDLILDYKTQMEEKHKEERRQLRKINLITTYGLSVRKSIYIPIIKLYNTFNEEECIKYKGYSRHDLNYIADNILREYDIEFKWRDPGRRLRRINGTY